MLKASGVANLLAAPSSSASSPDRSTQVREAALPPPRRDGANCARAEQQRIPWAPKGEDDDDEHAGSWFLYNSADLPLPPPFPKRYIVKQNTQSCVQQSPDRLDQALLPLPIFLGPTMAASPSSPKAPLRLAQPPESARPGARNLQERCFQMIITSRLSEFRVQFNPVPVATDANQILPGEKIRPSRAMQSSPYSAQQPRAICENTEGRLSTESK